MKHRKLMLLLVAVVLLCTGCSNTVNKEETPITITVWHVYGGQTDSPLNDLIDEFNQTVGKEQQINVQVTSVSNTNTIHELVLAAGATEEDWERVKRPIGLKFWCWRPPTESRELRSCPTFSSPTPRR